MLSLAASRNHHFLQSTRRKRDKAAEQRNTGEEWHRMERGKKKRERERASERARERELLRLSPAGPWQTSYGDWHDDGCRRWEQVSGRKSTTRKEEMKQRAERQKVDQQEVEIKRDKERELKRER